MDEVFNILQMMRERIANNLDAFRITATGRTRDSLKVERYDEGCRLIADGTGAPIETTEVGSPPHWVPIAALKEWADARWHRYGEMHNPYAVQRSIAKNGTQRFRSPRGDVYTQVVEEMMPELEKALHGGTSEIITNFMHDLH